VSEEKEDERASHYDQKAYSSHDESKRRDKKKDVGVRREVDV
jgi:hypothetical protein